MRSSEEKGGTMQTASNLKEPAPNPKIRIAVFGQHEVGKSALTVRYLTKRYIGEYKSSTDLLYQQTVKIGHNSIDVEIVDISTSAERTQSRRKSFPVEEIQRADGFVIVYSITDRNSFTFAQEALQTITNHYNLNHGPPPNSQNSLSTPSSSRSGSSSSATSSPSTSPQPRAICPILLVANKLDLEHLRVVEKVEGLSCSMQFDCHFYELSVAENSPEVYTSFQSLIGNFIAQNKEPSKRKFSVSKMLGNLRIGRTSPSHQVITSQASICDTDILSDDAENIPRSPKVALQRQQSLSQSVPEAGPSVSGSATPSGTGNNGSSFHHLKSKLVELHSMKKRHNSPPICSL